MSDNGREHKFKPYLLASMDDGTCTICGKRESHHNNALNSVTGSGGVVISGEDTDDQATQWIPVSERLPEHGQQVLTYSGVEGFRLITKGALNTVGTGMPCGVSYWMPLPPTPEAE